MCAPTPAGKAAFAALGQRNSLQVSGTSRGEAGRAAAGAYSKAKDLGDTLRIPLSVPEQPPPRPKYQGWMNTSLPKGCCVLGSLGGRA